MSRPEAFQQLQPQAPRWIADSYLKTKLLLSTAQMKAALETSSDVQKKPTLQPWQIWFKEVEDKEF